MVRSCLILLIAMIAPRVNAQTFNEYYFPTSQSLLVPQRGQPAAEFEANRSSIGATIGYGLSDQYALIATFRNSWNPPEHIAGKQLEPGVTLSYLHHSSDHTLFSVGAGLNYTHSSFHSSYYNAYRDAEINSVTPTIHASLQHTSKWIDGGVDVALSYVMQYDISITAYGPFGNSYGILGWELTRQRSTDNFMLIQPGAFLKCNIKNLAFVVHGYMSIFQGLMYRDWMAGIEYRL